MMAKRPARRRVRGRSLQFSLDQWAGGLNAAPIRDSLASELLAACMTALRGYGLSTARLVRMSKKAALERRADATSARAVLDMAQRLADLVAKWGEDPEFLDTSGRPAVLPISGARSSFQVLAEYFFPQSDISEIVTFGCRANAMEPVGRAKVARINDCVVFTGNSTLILAHSVRTVCRFLNTANFNRQQQLEISAGRPDRTSCGEISAADYAEFIRVMRPRISDLVEMSDRWLGQRSIEQQKGDKPKTARTAGVQAFLFCD